ncbi:ABC transporter permease [Streptomyces sp. NPDC087420]|uniref:ABC transporter permease n=1 Tax=Streptomyces sp. NPDC087420 TaxID=3365785 RepID=UPI003833482A
MNTLVTETETETAPASAPASAKPETADHRVTGTRVLRSEWAKLRSLRSTWITLGLTLVILISFALIFAFSYAPGEQGPASDISDGVAVALGGVGFAQLTLGVLGVLVMAGEYSTGMIRSTLSAVPARLPVLWSKIAGFGALALVVSTVAVFAAFLSVQGVIGDTDLAVGLTDAGVVRSLLGAGFSLALVGVLGVATGAVLRSVAGGIGLLVGLLMLLPFFCDLLPSAVNDAVSPYLPSNAAGSMFTLHPASDALSPGTGLVALAGWVAVSAAGAAWRLKRSDV